MKAKLDQTFFYIGDIIDMKLELNNKLNDVDVEKF